MILPEGRPPTKEDLIVIGIAGMFATLVAWVRTAIDGRIYAFGARIAVISAGTVIGTVAGLLCVAYDINMFITIAVSSISGATGEFVIISMTKLGLAIADDPVELVERVVRLRTGIKEEKND